MAKKKKVTKPVEVVEEVKEVEPNIEVGASPELLEQLADAFNKEIEARSAPPDLAIEPETVSTPALPDKMARVRNQGLPFPCDLTAYGYGMRWPTNAVYTIPTSKYIQLLKQGLEGVSA